MRKYKIDIIKWALIGTCIITFILIAVYIYRFHNHLSFEHSDFAEFGSYLGSITGLLAFIGVLYTVKESRTSGQIENERTTFYSLLELYQRQVDNMKYQKKDGIEAFKECANNACYLFSAHIIYYYIKNEKKFPTELTGFINKKDYQEIYDICEVKSLSELRDEIKSEFESLSEYKDNINGEFPQNSTIIVNIWQAFINNPSNNLCFFATKSICDEIVIKKKKYNLIYQITKNVGNILYGGNQEYLGQYYRNIYYLLDTIAHFKYPNNYSKIFRAQISSNELTILLFNAMSTQSSKRTILLLREFDIFNNINSSKLELFGFAKDSHTISKTISSLFQEFLSDPNNK